MSLSSDLNKLRKKRLEEEENKKSSTGDIAPVYSSIPTAKGDYKTNQINARASSRESKSYTSPVYSSTPTMLDVVKAAGKKATITSKVITPDKEDNEDKKRTWFSSGAFSDGYDFGDVTKTILGSATDLVSNFVGGALEMGEKAVDAGAFIVGGVGEMLGYDDFANDTKDFIAKDLYDGEKIASYTVGAPTNLVLALLGEDDYDDVSIWGEKIDSLVQSGGQLAGTIGLQAAGVPWYITSGVTSFGSEVESAFNEGATYSEAGMSGLISAGAELLTEKLFGGSGLGEKGLINVDFLTKGISSKALKALADFGVDMATEAGEEVASEFISTLGRQLTYERESTWKELLTDEQAMDDYIYQVGESLFGEEARENYAEAAIGGGVLGGFANVRKAKNSIKSGRDYRTGLTTTEETVVNKEVEKRIAEKEANGEKVTSEEKAEIFDKVVEGLDKGYISIDTIEEALGGEDYNTYKTTSDSEAAKIKELEDQLKELENAPNTIGNMQKYNALQKQIDSLKNNSKSAELKNKLSNDVYGIAKDTRLMSSYVEKANRQKGFEADVNEYKNENAKQTIQNAIKAGQDGLIYNGRDAHTFVDLAAKMSDKGYVVEFHTSESIAKLKADAEDIYGLRKDDVDPNKVRAFVSEKQKKIILNMDAKKSLNSLVGHEITDTIREAKYYDSLKDIAFKYAETKGELESRRKSVADRYSNITADLDGELTSDIVGDYLFTDENFIRELSTKHRNIAQKIYDEIKYILKLATAGSREARQLEQLKHTFEKIWRESAETNNNKSKDTKYSVNSDNSIDKKYDYGYNRAYGWVTTNNIINAGQRANFDTKFAGIVANGDAVQRTNTGEYMIPVSDIYNSKTEGIENTIIFASGTIDNPVISSVIKIDADNETKLSELRRIIYEAERRGIQQKTEGIFRRYDSSDYANARTGKSGLVRGNGYNNKLGANRRRGSGKNKKSVSYRTTAEGYKQYNLRPYKTSSKDGVFSNAKKTKYSLSDSDGKALTNEQSEFFKDSKMRDDNGNLKVMYHGSQNAGFHIFDPSMSDDNSSLFFVDRNDVAASYSGTSETYEARTIKTAEDMNNFIEEIGAEGYEVVEENGKFKLLYEGERVAESDTPQGIYKEFTWYEGIGEGDANYKVYLNLKNPLIVDAEGRNWNFVTREFSQEIADRYNSLTAEEKAALSDLADWGDYGIFRSELISAVERGRSGKADAVDKAISSAYRKLNVVVADVFSIASDNFSEESIKQFAVKEMNTRDYAAKAKAEGYDGVIFKNIHDNGGYSNGSEGASTVAVAFSSEQVKSVANMNPTSDPDIRYSLSEDSEGRAISPAVQKRFANSKAVDENGSLKVLYHGTATGEFSIFDKSKGSVEGDFGSGFYFTDNEADVSEHYEGGGPDFDNKVGRRADEIWNEEPDIEYEEAERRAREELYKGSHKFEVYLNIENPAIVGETTLLDSESYYDEYDINDYDNEDDYYADVEQLVADDIENIIWEVERNVDVNSTEGLAEVLWDAFNSGGIGIEELKKNINNLYLEDSYGMLLGNEVTRQVIESLGYDGIIDPTVSGKWNMDIEPGTSHYIVFKPNQIKAITNENPTDNPDIHRSLAEGNINKETPKEYGKFNIYAKDIRVKGHESVAPLRGDSMGEVETAKTTENTAPTENAVQSKTEGVTETEENVAPEGFAPITEADAEVMRNESFNSLDDADAPDEVDAPYYGDNVRDSVKLGKITADKISREVANKLGLDATDRARMMELIEKYAQNENVTAQNLFDEIQKNFLYTEEINTAELDDVMLQAKNHMRKKKVYINPDKKADFVGMGYNSFNDFKKAHFGHFYITTQKSAGALSVDQLYGELSELYPSIFPDDVWNVADQLKIMGEVADNANVTEYRETPYDDDTINEVVDIINKGISEYSEKETLNYLDTARANYLESVAADDIAPPVEEAPKIEKKVTESENIAPPTFDTANKNEVKGQQTMFAETDTEAETPKVAETDTEAEARKVAEVMTEEPKTQKRKNRILSKFRTNFLDKGATVEDLALKTGNRELDAKYNFMRYSESRAQEHIKNRLKPIVEKVERTGKTQEFYEYAYHLHNIDRMSLESNAKAKLAELKGKFGRLKFKQIQAIALTEITDKTTEKTAQTIREAREYLNALDSKNKPVFGDTVTADVSREAVKKFEAENPEFKELANAVVEYNAELRKMLVDGNVISQETADLWAKMYPHYVPIRRLGKEGLGVTVPLDTRKTGINAPIKRATGGDSDILPLLDTMAMRTEQTYKAIARNSFGLELMHTFNPEAKSESVSVDEVFDSFDNKYDELLTEGKNGQNPTFTVFENGKRVTFDITEDIYDSLKPTSEGLKYTNKVANTANNVFRGLLTEYNPVFMATNAIKDAQDILINSQHPAKTYARIPQAIREMAKNGKWYQEYIANGGEQNTYFDSESKTFKKENKKWVKAVGMPIRAISVANNFIERLPRLAEYIESRESGRSIEVSMLDAARITTNFAAGGDVTKAFDRNGATFLNASVQGFNQQIRNVREAKANGLKGWLKLATKIAVAGLPAIILNNLLWDDDEEYEELSDYIKDNYYIVAKYGDGKFIRIPKGRTVAVIQNAFEQVSNAVTGDDEVDFKRFFDLAISNLAPNNPLDNSIVAPIKQVVENKAWYGDDIVPTRLQDLPASEQYDESTDAFSKWIGETFDVSPYKVNYLLNQYSGGIGDVILPMITPETDGGGLLAAFKDKFTTDSVLKNQNVSDFYDTVDEVTKNAKSSKATDEDILSYKYMNSISSELSDLYAQKREIQNSDLSDKEKYEAVREIQEQINSIAKEALDSYGDVDIDGSYAKVGDVHFRWYEPGEDSTTEPGWRKIDGEQYEKQEEVTKALGISAGEYWKNKEEYDFAYEKPGKYAVAKSVGGYSTYKSYQSDLYDIKADKDEDGKSISGSRKEKVIEYINNLEIDYYEKLILFKNEYNADDSYNYEIIEYLNSREDISYKEMESILKELGFTVDSDGNIYWD